MAATTENLLKTPSEPLMRRRRRPRRPETHPDDVVLLDELRPLEHLAPVHGVAGGVHLHAVVGEHPGAREGRPVVVVVAVVVAARGVEARRQPGGARGRQAGVVGGEAPGEVLRVAAVRGRAVAPLQQEHGAHASLGAVVVQARAGALGVHGVVGVVRPQQSHGVVLGKKREGLVARPMRREARAV